jgi:glycosyltransferase involved in cell wall biosynthesis
MTNRLTPRRRIADGRNTDSLVSIIIPFLNAERFLSESIASLFCQTYENWELILVNDGSTDRSATIADLYAQERPSQVRCVQHPGLSTLASASLATSESQT